MSYDITDMLHPNDKNNYYHYFIFADKMICIIKIPHELGLELIQFTENLVTQVSGVWKWDYRKIIFVVEKSSEGVCDVSYLESNSTIYF